MFDLDFLWSFECKRVSCVNRRLRNEFCRAHLINSDSMSSSLAKKTFSSNNSQGKIKQSGTRPTRLPRTFPRCELDCRPRWTFDLFDQYFQHIQLFIKPSQPHLPGYRALANKHNGIISSWRDYLSRFSYQPRGRTTSTRQWQRWHWRECPSRSSIYSGSAAFRRYGSDDGA